ncbi:MAG TPA: hypothetical protein VGP64_15490 [Polyangia bacterium]|jgi:hypothetical protein
MKLIHGKARLWRIAEWCAVSAALGWLFLWAAVATRRRGGRRDRGSPARSLRTAADGGAPA